MEPKVNDFEVIQRVINTTQVILPIYEASFKYKDHYYSIRNTVFTNKSDAENVKWAMQCGFMLYEFSDKINGEIWNVYYFSLKEYIKYAELDIAKEIPFYIIQSVFDKIVNNFINEDFKKNPDKYYSKENQIY